MDLSDAKKILEKGRKILLKTGPWRLILICLCGILIVALSSGTGEKKTVLQEESIGENQIKNQWQQELSTVLSKMEGVGKCQVVVSVSEDEKNNYLRIGINVLHFNKHTFLPAAENTVVLIDEIQGIQVQPV